MKAERVQKEEFQPILITIETEAEAKALWHRLNVGTEALVGYIHSFRFFDKGVTVEDIRDKGMWKVFDSVYNARNS